MFKKKMQIKTINNPQKLLNIINTKKNFFYFKFNNSLSINKLIFQ